MDKGINLEKVVQRLANRIAGLEYELAVTSALLEDAQEDLMMLQSQPEGEYDEKQRDI